MMSVVFAEYLRILLDGDHFPVVKVKHVLLSVVTLHLNKVFQPAIETRPVFRDFRDYRNVQLT